MSKQLNIFEQQRRERYEEYKRQFYAVQLREAEERKRAEREPQIDYIISINPDNLGKKMCFNGNFEIITVE